MSAVAQADFIRDHLGPALHDAGLSGVAIFCYDHNCDRPDYPIAVLDDVETRQFVAGVAWHLYGGKPSALRLKKAVAQFTLDGGKSMHRRLCHHAHIPDYALPKEIQTKVRIP